MNFIIKINDRTPKAKSIVKMLKELAKDYSFLEISSENNELSENVLEELEARYNYVLENIEEGKSWEEVKSSLLSK